MIFPVLFSAAATAGFAVIFKMRGMSILFAGIGGALSWFLYLLLNELVSSFVLSYFVAAFGVALYAELAARLSKRSAAVFISCAIIPLVPGEGIYQTMAFAIHNRLEESLSMGFKTLAIAAGIGAGVAFAASITKLIVFFVKPSLRKQSPEKDR